MEQQALSDAGAAGLRGMPIAKPVLDAKAFSTLRARPALLGCTLIRADNDRCREIFIVARGALCRELDGVEAIDAWLQLLGGPVA